VDLVYRGNGDYDLICRDVVVELSYDGSDIMVGAWTFWNVRVGDQRFGGTQLLGPGEFTDWLETRARDEQGRLSDEPEASMRDGEVA
jgi:hypothetical protein